MTKISAGRSAHNPVTGTTRVTGLYGWPVRHTLSPAMHNAAFAARRLPFVYLPFEVSPDDLRAAVGAIRALGLAGVNVTIPHKEKVMPFLDRIDPAARAIGSVNTIVNKDGVLTGHNTDAPGFIADLRAHRCEPRKKRALMVGSGGGARAVAAALITAGVRELIITGADARQAAALAGSLKRARTIPLAAWKSAIAGSDILINATPVGMKATDAPLATARDLHRGLFVYDLVYSHPTGLLREARAAGARCADGLGMLLRQGALAFELWTGTPAPLAVMRRALENAIKGRYPS